MDNSQSVSSISDEFRDSIVIQQDGDLEEAHPHIHMPNPSYWPLLLGLSVGFVLGGMLFINSFPLITIVALICSFVCMLGWALENPMAPLKETFITVPRAVEVDPWKFKVGQNVVDAQRKWLGKIQARFTRYVLVERGRLLPKVYYVPQSAIRDQVKNNTIFLTLSEDDLVRMELDRVPADLYDEVPDDRVPSVRGVPQFAKRPLSPAETGHYNYGRMFPGMNTDASGSYHREEVRPQPTNYVREDVYTTDEAIPPRVTSPD